MLIDTYFEEQPSVLKGNGVYLTAPLARESDPPPTITAIVIILTITPARAP